MRLKHEKPQTSNLHLRTSGHHLGSLEAQNKPTKLR